MEQARQNKKAQAAHAKQQRSASKREALENKQAERASKRRAAQGKKAQKRQGSQQKQARKRDAVQNKQAQKRQNIEAKRARKLEAAQAKMARKRGVVESKATQKRQAAEAKKAQSAPAGDSRRAKARQAAEAKQAQATQKRQAAEAKAAQKRQAVEAKAAQKRQAVEAKAAKKRQSAAAKKAKTSGAVGAEEFPSAQATQAAQTPSAQTLDKNQAKAAQKRQSAEAKAAQKRQAVEAKAALKRQSAEAKAAQKRQSAEAKQAKQGEAAEAKKREQATAAEAKRAAEEAKREQKRVSRQRKRTMREDRRLAQRQDRRDRGSRSAASGKTTRAERAGQRELSRRRQRAQIGVEFDGSTVRIVEVHDGEIVWMRAYGPEMPGTDAIRDWLDSRPRNSRKSSEPVVTWAGTDSHLRVVEVLAYSNTALSRRLNSALEGDLPERPGTYVLSAIKGASTTVDVAADAGVSAISDDAIEVAFDTMAVVAIQAATVEEIWQAVVDAKAELTASEFTLAEDGLYLSLRNSRAALVLRSNGIPRVSRDLPIGGFDELVSRATETGLDRDEVLHSLIGAAESSPSGDDLADSAAPAESPLAAPGGGRVSDEQLQSLVNTYAFSLASEVRASVGYWQGLGLAVPSEVQISGAGAAIAGVTDHFEFMGMQASPTALPMSVRTNGTPTRDVMAFHGALTAAVASPDVSLGFLNPLREQARQHRRELRRRAVRGLVIVAIAALSGWFLMRPYLSAQSDLDAAIAARDQAVITVNQRAGIESFLRDVGAAQTSSVALTLAEPHWAVAIESLRSVSPSNATLLTMDLTTADCLGVAGAADTGDQADAAAQPEGEVSEEPPTLEETLPAVACISVEMLAVLPEAESGDQRLTQTAQWVRDLEGIGGIGVWPSVKFAERGAEPAPEASDALDPLAPSDSEAEPEPVEADDEAVSEPAAEMPEEAVETDPASLTNDARLALLMELNLPNAPPYRAPRALAQSDQSLDGENG